jgi:hypothetical protein
MQRRDRPQSQRRPMMLRTPPQIGTGCPSPHAKFDQAVLLVLVMNELRAGAAHRPHTKGDTEMGGGARRHQHQQKLFAEHGSVFLPRQALKNQKKG